MRTSDLACFLCLTIVVACGSDAGENDPILPGPPVPGDEPPTDGPIGDGTPANALASTLTATCATLQGRAVVNENGNFGVAFTESDSPFSLIGSIQWELPSGHLGSVPNPENWNGSGSRQIIAATSPTYELFGNHCWFGGSPPANTGSVTMHAYNPQTGVVRATFVNYVLHSCVDAGTCTINGSIETTGEGVFE